MIGVSTPESVIQRDRLWAGAGLGIVVTLAWGWTLFLAPMPTSAGMGGMAGMPGMHGSAVATVAPWSASHAILMFGMWWIMMVAMMLPSAAPLALIAIALHRRGGGQARIPLIVGLLMAGYLGVWGAFSLGATLVQWGLHSANLLAPATMAVGPNLAALILVGAGLYQFAPPKRACLRHCRSPVEFLTAHWRAGARGAFRIGTLHGLYCLGCCWVLMALLFVGGVMSPFWIGGIALYILVEKYAPHGDRIGRAAGAVLFAGGVLTLLRVI